jgi:hypothetical protein
MRLPAFLRYLPARLAPAANPIVWIPVLALGLVGVFAWEYYNHPDWLSWSGPELDSTADNSGLTPEERGQVAELDNLDVLLNDPNLNRPNLSSPITPTDGSTVAGQSAGGQATSAEVTDASSRRPFAEYLEQYSLLGAPTDSQSLTQSVLPTPDASRVGLRGGTPGSSVTPGSATTGLATAGGSDLSGTSPGISSTATTPMPESPLALAIQQLSAGGSRTTAVTGRTTGGLTTAQTSGRSSEASITADRGLSLFPASQSVQQQGGIPGTLPGSPNVPFIRTTPAMSPPPGTTGYTPPSSLNLTTFNRTFNQSSAFPSGTSTAVPTFDLRRPQTAGGALPTPGDFQTQRVSPGASPFGATTVPQTVAPRSAWDSFWGSY